MHILSKSTYMRGCQCPKALWFHKNRPELRPPVQPVQQAIFDQGTAVGLLARQRWPDGMDCSPEHHYDYQPALEKTRRAMTGGASVVYEAAFQHEDVLAALDILVRDGDGWMAVEVKSSTSVKEQFIEDAAFQYHVITASGIPITRIGILHLDGTYVRQGPIDVQRLFHLADITHHVRARQETVRERIRALKEVIIAPAQPDVDIGPHCNSPYACDFKPHCWSQVPSPSVFDLTHAGDAVFELYHRGIMRLEDIPSDEPLTHRQRVQVEAQRSGRTVIDRDRIRAFVQGLKYPVRHMDFETISTAVPLYEGTRPYQPIPFQYSLHLQHERGAAPSHLAFLADGRGDPREAFLVSLLRDVGTFGDILAYNLSFERRVLNELTRDFPQYAQDVSALLRRCKDLAEPFAKLWYYAPAMQGSYSIKNVLPALVPGLRYDDLAIGSGDVASLLFAQWLQGNYPGDPAQLRKDLLDYCGLDTFAMVNLLGALERVV